MLTSVANGGTSEAPGPRRSAGQDRRPYGTAPLGQVLADKYAVFNLSVDSPNPWIPARLVLGGRDQLAEGAMSSMLLSAAKATPHYHHLYIQRQIQHRTQRV